MTTRTATTRRQSVTTPSPSLPSDPRFEQLEAALKRHQYHQDALIEVLHAAQKLFGFLEPSLLHFVARQLKLPPSRVYGVANRACELQDMAIAVGMDHERFDYVHPHREVDLSHHRGAGWSKDPSSLVRSRRRALIAPGGGPRQDSRANYRIARCGPH